MGANFFAAESNELSIYIDPAALAAAAPGTYTCDLSYTSLWYYESGEPVTATATGSSTAALAANGNLTISGGTVEATGGEDSAGIYGGTVNISGGNVTATATATGTYAYDIYAEDDITLSWADPADQITASCYYAGGTLTLNRLFTDGDPAALTPDDNYYAGTIDPARLANVTLRAFGDEEKNVTMAPEGYGTYYNSQHDLHLPEGVKARIVTANDGGTLTYATIADGSSTDLTQMPQTVPAGTAVMLQTAPGATLGLLALAAIDIDTRDFTQASGNNGGLVSLLHGSDVEGTTTGDGKHYKLTYNTSGEDLGWYWGAADGAPFTTAAHKAWLVLANGSNARSFGLPDWDSETTKITTTNLTNYTNSAGAWYTLDGRKLDKQPTKAGLYINNGRKVVIK